MNRFTALLALALFPLDAAAQSAMTHSPITPASDGWELCFCVGIPLFKVTESTREDAELDVFIFTAAAGGLSIKKVDPSGKSSFSISPLTILLSGDTSKEDNPLDLSLAVTIGTLDNRVMLGFGRDFGELEEGRSRWFGLLSLILAN